MLTQNRQKLHMTRISDHSLSTKHIKN